MAQRGPLVTAVVVVGGLVGLMTANAAGGLVTASSPSPTPSPAGATQTEQPTTTTEQPPATTTPPPAKTTTEKPPTQPPPPATSGFPAEVLYAGKTVDSPLWVAVAVKGTDSSAYICDGEAVESWMTGTATNGTVDLKSKDGANTLTAKLNNGMLAGTVSIAGQPHDFNVGVAKPPAGLYRGQDGQTTVGWIILSNGQQVGIARSGGKEASAPPLNPANGGAMVNGTFVPAEKVTGETRFG